MPIPKYNVGVHPNKHVELRLTPVGHKLPSYKQDVQNEKDIYQT